MQLRNWLWDRATRRLAMIDSSGPNPLPLSVT
jgi:hypothetical protein